jgi:hypothetical protein
MTYTIVYGFITDKGKFEGERAWVPLFYELMLEESGDTLEWPDGTSTTFIAITPADRKRYPELVNYAWVALETNDQGMVFGKAMTEETITEIERQNEAEWLALDADQTDSPAAEEAH